MSQSSFNIANVTRSLFRSAVNAALQALGSKNSGAATPSETYPFMEWADTSADKFKVRNEANSAWIEQGKTEQPYGFSKLRGPVAAGGTADAITTTLGMPAWDGEVVIAIEHGAANTSGSVTLAIDGLAAKSAYKGNNVALTANDIPGANFLGLWRYDASLDKVQLLNPNTLSDYQAGTWTPTLVASTNGPTAATGWYVKIGSLVCFGCNVTFPTQTDADNSTIVGPPFTPLYIGSANIYSDETTCVRVLVSAGAGRAEFVLGTSAGGAISYTTMSGNAVVINGSYLA